MGRSESGDRERKPRRDRDRSRSRERRRRRDRSRSRSRARKRDEEPAAPKSLEPERMRIRFLPLFLLRDRAVCVSGLKFPP